MSSLAENYRIRPFRAKDAEAVHALGRTSPEASQWSVESYERLYDLGQVAWVVELTGALSGFIVARVISPEMEILNLVVAAEVRRKGIAASLFAAAQKEAHEKNVSRIFLEVRESNAAAIAFYGRHGFAKSGIRAKYYRDPVESAIVMEKEIPS